VVDDAGGALGLTGWALVTTQSAAAGRVADAITRPVHVKQVIRHPASGSAELKFGIPAPRDTGVRPSTRTPVRAAKGYRGDRYDCSRAEAAPAEG